MLNDVGLGVLADSTYVVEGPPGAGKTALMAQCVSEVAVRPATSEGRIWLPVIVHSSVTNSARALGRDIDRAIASRVASPAGKPQRDGLLSEIGEMIPDLEPVEQRAARDAFTFLKESAANLERTVISRRDALFDRLAEKIPELLNAYGVGRAQAVVRNILSRGVSITGFATGPSREAPNPSITDVVEDRRGAWDAYQIVVFVDEGQNIPPSGPPGEDMPSVLSHIHEGKAGAPLSLCVFGLWGTWVALKAVGISRTVAERDIALGALSEQDCAKAVRRCFGNFHVTNGEGWERAIVSRSQQWPQHLAGFMAAAMQELRKHKRPGGGYDAGPADFEAAIAAGDRTREHYYRQRAKSLGSGGQVELAARLASALRNTTGLSHLEVSRLLIETDSTISEKEREAFLSAAYRSGFLSYDYVEQKISMPIPSFAGFLLKDPPAPTPNPHVADGRGDYVVPQTSSQKRPRTKGSAMRP